MDNYKQKNYRITYNSLTYQRIKKLLNENAILRGQVEVSINKIADFEKENVLLKLAVRRKDEDISYLFDKIEYLEAELEALSSVDTQFRNNIEEETIYKDERINNAYDRSI